MLFYRTGLSSGAMGNIQPSDITSSRHVGDAVASRPGRIPDGVIHHFTRGKEHPQGVVWFGARSFWGHMRHLIASAIATDSIDSRDWMTPDEPGALAARIAAMLGGNPRAATLIEALNRDLYVDFVADTG